MQEMECVLFLVLCNMSIVTVCNRTRRRNRWAVAKDDRGKMRGQQNT